MKRRSLLATAFALPTALLLARRGWSDEPSFDPRPSDTWRTFDLVTDVEILQPAGDTRAWVPIPAFEASWQRPGRTQLDGNARSARVVRGGVHGPELAAAEWPATEKAPKLTVTSTVAVRERGSGLSGPAHAGPLAGETRERFTRGTALMPTGGIIATTAAEITRGARTDVDQARAIYEWVVEHGYRDPQTRGCGTGDVKAMFDRGSFGGKCADLNALYVTLARAAGLPARDVYGIRVAKSAFGYRSLGAASSTITKSQHCRAEVFLAGHGWIAVDPADVRKVVLEEKESPIPLDDPTVDAVRRKLFGACEMNWVAYNDAHDIELPGSKDRALGFLMYPQAETDGGRIDCLDPDRFRYTITVRETPAA